MEWMEWIKAPWYSWPALIGWIVAAVVVVKWAWPNVLVPTGRAVMWVVDETQMHRMMREVYAHFRPNHGTSLWDRITQLERNDEQIAADVLEIKNLIQQHVVERMPGGNRRSDPDEPT